jgi:large subunit ribosomal protein L30
MSPSAKTDASIRVTQTRSRNGADKAQLATLRSLGLRHIRHTVEVGDNEQIRGMLHRVRHLVHIEEPSK